MNNRRNMYNRNRHSSNSCCEPEVKEVEKPPTKAEIRSEEARTAVVVKRCAITVLTFVILIWLLQIGNLVRLNRQNGKEVDLEDDDE